MLKKQNLIEYFYQGIKSKNNLKIGVEHEKFVLNKKNLSHLSYNEPNGIKDILLRFVNDGWKPKYDDNNTTIIALERFGENITLEPGGQIELSGAQLSNIHQTCSETSRHLVELKNIGEEFDFILLGLGVEPSLTLEEFSWVPKQRYNIMKKYMTKVGSLGHHMMKRTCTNQVNLDFYSEDDMKRKYRLMLNLEAIATAMFANSPFEKKNISKFKSLRSHFWHHTDKDRTGIIPFVFEKGFSFEKYVEYALDVPMYFIIRNHKYIDMTQYTFREFFLNKTKINLNTEPTLNDWKDHLSTLFPQVRLKQFLEIRSMDACSWDLICSQPAFWTGLLYDENSLNKTQEIVEGWSHQDRDYLNKNTPKEGLSCRFKEETVLNIAQNLFEISKEGLDRRNILDNKKQYNETYYLKDLEKNLSNNQSPADVLINKFYNNWNKDINNIYSENIF
mgnify:CR=1 FL=1